MKLKDFVIGDVLEFDGEEWEVEKCDANHDKSRIVIQFARASAPVIVDTESLLVPENEPLPPREHPEADKSAFTTEVGMLFDDDCNKLAGMDGWGKQLKLSELKSELSSCADDGYPHRKIRESVQGMSVPPPEPVLTDETE